MIDLREKDRRAILKIAADTLPGNATLLAYGSRVKGSHHDASDLDLAIRTPEDHPLPTEALVDFRLALQESNIPILVQAFDWNRLPEGFRYQIEAVHETLWQGEDV